MSLQIQERDIIAFPIAALLHDVGHGPLSHVWEQYVCPPTFPSYNHENVSLALISSEHTDIGHFFQTIAPQEFHDFPYIYEDVIDFLRKTHRLYYLLPLLSGNLDVDRLDFMARDTRSAGVTYGFHDLDWIIRSFRFARIAPEHVQDDPSTIVAPFWTIAVDGRKGLNTLNQFIFARENMYSLVYLHKTVRSASILLQNIFTRAAHLSKKGQRLKFVNSSVKRVFSGNQYKARDVIGLDDHSIWEQIEIWSQSTCKDYVLRELCSKLLRRDLYKVFVLEKKTYNLIKSLEEEDGNRYLSALVSAKLGIDLSDAKYYFGFDRATFNLIGRDILPPESNVWIMEEGLDDHKFTSLRQYYARRYDELDVEHFYLAVDPRLVEEINLLVEHISHMDAPVSVSEAQSGPTDFRLLATLGKEGVWKSVYLGVSSRPGVDSTNVVALKSYKVTEEAQKAIERDVIKVNLLVGESPGNEYLSTGRYLGAFGGKEWLWERLWASSLYDLIVQSGLIKDAYELVRLGANLFAGLQLLHSKGIRHTDIKPDNCGVLRHGGKIQRYVLGDFGCVTPRHDEVPTDPLLEGTIRTRAPEVFQFRKFGLPGDVWAMGATIFSVAVGRYPFMALNQPHETPEERRKREKATKRDMPKLLDAFRRDCDQSLPPVVANLLRPCFAEDPAKRATAVDSAEAFSSTLRDLNGVPGRSELARSAWAQVEDLLSQSALTGRPVPEEQRLAMNLMLDYVPKSLFSLI